MKLGVAVAAVGMERVREPTVVEPVPDSLENLSHHRLHSGCACPASPIEICTLRDRDITSID
jgi:hypothetical protein